MRTLFEIVESAKDGIQPTAEECYWAMLALDAVSIKLSTEMLRLTAGEPVSETIRKAKGKFCYEFAKSAMAHDPQRWLGPNHDPANPEVQRFRKLAFEIMERVEKKMEDDDE